MLPRRLYPERKGQAPSDTRLLTIPRKILKHFAHLSLHRLSHDEMKRGSAKQTIAVDALTWDGSGAAEGGGISGERRFLIPNM